MSAPDLDTLHLGHGAHDSREDGMCLLEAVAWVAGEPHSDHPECVCPVIAVFGRNWNDGLPDDARNRLLKPLIPALIGTYSTPAVEHRRAWMCADWLVRVQTPAWLRLAGLHEHADTLAGLAPLVDVVTAAAARPAIDAARAAVRAAAWAAGWDGAWAAVWAAAGPAARAAARDAARDAAWVAVGGAAMTAARAASRDAAMDAAWGAAWVLVGGAAWSAAADGVDLAPTVAMLQRSAVDLIHRMIEVRP